MGFIGDALGTKNKFNASAGPAVTSSIQGYDPKATYQGVGQTPTIGGAPQATANLQNPFTASDAQSQQGQLQGTAAQQQGFVNALNAQGGIGNQASVFGQQQMLANQLGQQAMGGGPNPALAQLSQSTSNNIKNQAALMAGARGASHNAGAMNKSIAEQGVMAQQQASGQAATMRAQQQLAAQQQLQAQQAGMANLATTQVGQQAQGINALGNLQLGMQGQTTGMLAAQNQANLGMQENLNNLNSQRAIDQAQLQQQSQMQSSANSLAMAQQQNSIGANMAQQANAIRAGNAQATSGNMMAAQGINAGVAGQNTATNNAITGGLLGAAGGIGASYAGRPSGYNGGQVSKFAGGGAITPPGAPPPPAIADYSKMQPITFAPAVNKGPVSSFGKATASGGSPEKTSFFGSGTWFPQNNGPDIASEDSQPLAFRHDENFGSGIGGSSETGIMANNQGKEIMAARGGNVGSKLKSGGHVPGKAKVSGDSLKNDTVSAKLSPGEVVIPRSVMNSRDPVKGSADFVAAILARKGK